MTLPPSEIAQRLVDAAASRQPITAFSDDESGLDVVTAYEVQREVVAARLNAGATVVGAKLGLTSRAKQQTMRVEEPLFGRLTSDMICAGAEPLALDGFIAPRVEPEIAFLLGDELTGPATVTSVLDATESVFGALEVIDSRYAGYRFRLPDVIMDNASAAGFVLGSVSRPPEQLEDLRLLGTVLRVGGEVVATAAGAAVLGHPAQAVAWLANQLAAQGESLPAGAIVLSGGLTDAFPITPGSTITAEFDGLGIAEVRA